MELKPGLSKNSLHTWYDTFDWRLFRKKRLLVRKGTEWVLQDFQEKQLLSWTDQQETFHLSGKLPESPLSNAIQNIIGIRALIELGVMDGTTTTIFILNRDKNIGAFLYVQELSNRQNGQRLITVTLEGVRGYNKKFQQIARILRASGVETQTKTTDILRFVLQDSGRVPLDYSSGYSVDLNPKMSSVQAVTVIYRSLLKSIKQNEQGVIDDIDSEFLHDLRVAVRRTRSALSLTKGVLATEFSDKLKQEFRYLGEITGPVRDLDVYLLSEEEYKSRLPERLQEGLSYFFEDLSRRRELEQKKLVGALQGPRYKKIITGWQQDLELKGELPTGEHGNVSIEVLAGKIIHKRFHRVLRDGRRIHQDTPDTELHRLRIECKKLRYSLEFFSSLYDQRQMKKLVAQLKRLQNNLGDFNDLSVQQEMLADNLSTIRLGSKKSREIAASLGGLMATLSLQHREVRMHFEKTFAHFSRKENLELFGRLFED